MKTIIELKTLQTSVQAVIEEDNCPICLETITEDIGDEKKTTRFYCCTRLICLSCSEGICYKLKGCPYCRFCWTPASKDRVSMIREHLNSADGLGKIKMKWAAFELFSYDPSLSYPERKDLLLLSANLGHCNAQKTLGASMLKELDPEGIPYAESALIAGDKAAGYDLGYYYYNTGQRKLAKTYWTIAADAGVPLAESHLGWFFYGTTGNCPDRQQSLDYLLKACMQNDPKLLYI